MKMKSKISQVHGTCRCCLTKGDHKNLITTYLYNLNGKANTFMDALLYCYNISLRLNPSLTALICNACIQRLEEASMFRMLIMKSEATLLEALGDQDNTEFVNVSETRYIEPEVNVFEVKIEEVIVKEEPVQEDDHTDSLVSEMNSNEDRCLIDINHAANLDLVPGERELLDRFNRVKPLPNRDSLFNICPKYLGYLEDLKDKSIQREDLEELAKTNTIKTRLKRNSAPKCKKEKMALVSNIATIFVNSNATAFRMKTKLGFPCLYCKEIFRNPENLREHQQTHSKSLLKKLLAKDQPDRVLVYADITDLKCILCDTNFLNLNDFKNHLIATHNKKFFDGYTDRVIPFKLENRESCFDCAVCGTSFETFGALDRHMSCHYKNFICELCGAGFITKRRYAVHSSLIHSNKTVTCEICKKILPSQRKYNDHIETIHNKKKKIKCNVCGDRFIDYFSRQRHLESVHGFEKLTYKCTYCTKVFNRKYSLKYHISRIHLKNKNVQCEHCSYMCYTSVELKEHMAVKHGVGDKLECKLCGTIYARRKALVAHMRTHHSGLK